MSATTKLRKSGELDHAQVRFQRGEGVIGDLGPRGGDARNQRGFAGVGKADQAHVGQQLQLQAQALFFARAARLVLGGRLVGGGGEARVALAAAAAARHHEALAGLGEIAQALAGGFVVDHRAHRHVEFDGMALGAGAVAAFAVAAALGLVLRVEAELQQRVFMRIGHQDDVAAAAAIAAAGPPRGTYFSRRKARQPLPPSPAFTRILASSINIEKPPVRCATGGRFEGPLPYGRATSRGSVWKLGYATS